MPTESKKHHYNPKYLLRNFSVPGRQRQIWVFDKTDNRPFTSSIANAGSENHFNRFVFRGETYNFEDLFRAVDGNGAALIRKILDQKSLMSLTAEELSYLALVAAIQLLRTKYPRTSMIEFSQQLAERIQELGYSEEQLEELLSFDDNEAKVAAFQGLLGADRVAAHLANKVIVLLANRSTMPLWTSDNPVVMYNAFRFGQIGLDAKGIEIYLPIAPDLCIAFYCRSHYIQLEEGYSSSHPRPAPEKPWFRELFHGMRHSSPVGIDADMVTYLNELQIGRSDRFLYSSSDDFELAVDYLNARPEHRDGRWRRQVGRVGEWNPASEGAPSGHIVVFHGQTNYFEMPVSDVVPERVAFRFSTSDDVKLSAIEQDCPLTRVEYYIDGQLRQYVGRATIERIPVVNARGELQARIKHTDESLNRLFEEIDRDA